MVTKPGKEYDEAFSRYILAKNHMVTKHIRVRQRRRSVTF